MTDPGVADVVYLEPLTVASVERILERERPDGLLAGLGGQTGLNLAIEVARAGVLERYGTRLLGTPIEAIEMAEDRERFRDLLDRSASRTPRRPSSRARTTRSGGGRRPGARGDRPAGHRPAGLHAGRHRRRHRGRPEAAYRERVRAGLRLSPIGQVMVERCLVGLAGDRVRGHARRGRHLHHRLLHGERRPAGRPHRRLHRGRARSRRCPTRCTSGCAPPPWPSSGRWASRAAATSSSRSRPTPRSTPSSRSTRGSAAPPPWPPRRRATPSPGWRPRSPSAAGFDEIPNAITGTTVAAFEPALDYVVVKLPRFPFDKFPAADRTLGSQMKATGEVMAIDRTFGAALNKALRGLEQAGAGFLAEDPSWAARSTCWPAGRPVDGCRARRHPRRAASREDLLGEVHVGPDGLVCARTGRRGCLEAGAPAALPAALGLAALAAAGAAATRRAGGRAPAGHRHRALVPGGDGAARGARAPHARGGQRAHRTTCCVAAKRASFGDRDIATLTGLASRPCAAAPRRIGLRPGFAMVDTCAAEFAAETPYFYATYAAAGSPPEAPPVTRPAALVIGSGPVRIGQGIEFDYCAVQAADALRERGLGGGHGQLQPGDRLDRLRRLVPALLRAARRGERARGHPRGDAAGRRAAAGARPVRRPDAAQPRRGAGGRGRGPAGPVARDHRPGRGAHALRQPGRAAGHPAAAGRHGHLARGGARRRRPGGLPGHRAALAS